MLLRPPQDPKQQLQFNTQQIHFLFQVRPPHEAEREGVPQRGRGSDASPREANHQGAGTLPGLVQHVQRGLWRVLHGGTHIDSTMRYHFEIAPPK